MLEEITEIHVGSGWCPLFEETEYYSSVDEYDREYSFKDLEEELFEDSDKEKSHLSFGTDYYIYREGYEFVRGCFS